jgi:XTP/dITP diphosphohydrolase
VRLIKTAHRATLQNDSINFMKQLIIASTNKHKTSELSQMLASHGYEVFGVDKFPTYKAPKETGKTFLENARLKAQALKKYLQQVMKPKNGRLILADDSGLACDDLNGAPGIFSARYARGDASDASNNRKLIKELQKITKPKLTAHYVCALVLIDDAGKEWDITETCEGQIVMTPQGSGGFGYDPHFFVPEFGKTMAELDAETKNQISHRGKALKKLVECLK